MSGRRRVGAALAALACAGALAAGPAALAATVTGPTNGLQISAIDLGRTVDLTLRLHPHPPFDDPPPGSLPPGGVAGTTVTVRQILGVDLRTSEGWARARAMTVDQARRGPFAHQATAITDAAGEAHFHGLPVGLYLVTSVPPDTDHDYPDSAPFLITLPTGGIGDWNYAPVVYAKPEPDGPPDWPPIIVIPPVVIPPGSIPGGSIPGVPPPEGTLPGLPPTAPPPPRSPAPPQRSEPGGPLPVTGAAVAAAAAAAAVLVGLGSLLLVLGRRRGAGPGRPAETP